MNACAEKNLVGIDISDAGDQLLVEQNRFHRATMFSEDFSELREGDVERVRAQGALFQKFVYILDQPDLTEFALILECEAVRIGENKEHSRVPRRLLLSLEIVKRTGHAEMQSQPQVVIGAHKQVFAMPATRFELAPFQPELQFARRDVL